MTGFIFTSVTRSARLTEFAEFVREEVSIYVRLQDLHRMLGVQVKRLNVFL